MLTACGVKVRNCTEQWLDTTTAMGELMIPIVAWVGKQEHLAACEGRFAACEGVQTSSVVCLLVNALMLP